MIDLLPLAQMCSGKSFQEYIFDAEFVQAFTCQYADTSGFLVLGLFVWTAVSSSIYIRTGSFLIPFGMLLMIGGAVLSQMASVAIPVAVLLILIIPGTATGILYVRYSR